jgi:hypothetical protein
VQTLTTYALNVNRFEQNVCELDTTHLRTDSSRVGKGEFHPQTSHRTVLDSLPSHGSSHSCYHFRWAGQKVAHPPLAGSWQNDLECVNPFAHSCFHKT